METSEFFDKIGDLDLRDRYSLNRGGCGCFALLALKFMPHLGIFYCCDSERDVYNAENGIEGSCSHVVLSDGYYYYDCTGTLLDCELEEDYDDIVQVSEDYLKRSLEKTGEWNFMFDRTQLPVIEKEVAQIYNQLKSYYDERSK